MTRTVKSAVERLKIWYHYFKTHGHGFAYLGFFVRICRLNVELHLCLQSGEHRRQDHGQEHGKIASQGTAKVPACWGHVIKDKLRMSIKPIRAQSLLPKNKHQHFKGIINTRDVKGILDISAKLGKAKHMAHSGVSVRYGCWQIGLEV